MSIFSMLFSQRSYNHAELLWFKQSLCRCWRSFSNPTPKCRLWPWCAGWRHILPPLRDLHLLTPQSRKKAARREFCLFQRIDLITVHRHLWLRPCIFLYRMHFLRSCLCFAVMWNQSLPQQQEKYLKHQEEGKQKPSSIVTEQLRLDLAGFS